jgi:hypothetical protein
MTPVTLTKTALTFTRSGPQMRLQLTALGIFPLGRDDNGKIGFNVTFHRHGVKPHYEVNWTEIRDTQKVPLTFIHTAQEYANLLEAKISNIEILVKHDERAYWRMGSPVLWASVHFMINKETTE